MVSTSKRLVSDLEQLPVLHYEEYASLIKRCSESRNLTYGKRVHRHMMRFESDGDTYLGNLLIKMYGECGRIKEARACFDTIARLNVFSWNIMIAAFAQTGHLQEARRLFDKAAARNVVMWNTMIAGYAQNGQCEQALEVFDVLDARPTVATFLAVLDACSSGGAGCLQRGRSIHRQICRHGMEWDARLGAAVVNMYGKCGSLEEAEEALEKMKMKMGGSAAVVVAQNAMLGAYAQNGHVEEAKRMFDAMEERTLVSWNTMLKAYVWSGEPHRALHLFRRMVAEGELQPNKISLSTALEACVTVAQGRQVWCVAAECELQGDVQVASAVVNMYARFGMVKQGRQAFDRVEDRRKDVVLWTSMISAYAHNGLMLDAKKLFDAAPAGHKNVVSWTCMITGYAQTGHPHHMLNMFRMMDLEGIQPNRVTLLCVVDACADFVGVGVAEDAADIVNVAAAAAAAADIHIRNDTLLGNALLNLYAKWGCIQQAWDIFGMLHQRSTTSWTAMITAYAHNGRHKEALELATEMVVEGVAPNQVTFVSLLSACSHSGQLDKAWQQFMAMVQDHNLEPLGFHYMCMVDALGRAGQLSRAEELLRTMPIEPDSVGHTSLLGACTLHRDAQTAARVVAASGVHSQQNSAPYVLLSNTYHYH